MAARRRTTARAAALPARRGVPELGRLAPSGRSVGAGLLLLAVAVCCYAAARETSLFAVRKLEIRGGTPALRAQVEQALADEVGKSLLSVGGSGLEARLAPIPGVRSFEFDRAFPHTLRVVVRREVPVLVVRLVPGTGAYLVSATGRVLKSLPRSRLSHLPRLWVTKSVQLTVGGSLPRGLQPAAEVLAALQGAPLPGGVATVTSVRDALSLKLGSGFEVRLGDDGDLRLKLAIARRIMRATGAAQSRVGYLDVSVPARPVLTTNSQVAG